jgi:hypothetical protein
MSAISDNSTNKIYNINSKIRYSISQKNNNFINNKLNNNEN